jgi:hypothetical protein
MRCYIKIQDVISTLTEIYRLRSNLFPSLTLTAISCWFLIKERFVKQTQNTVASVENDLWKLDHAIALLWTGIMGVLSLVVIYLLIGNLAMMIIRGLGIL